VRFAIVVGDHFQRQGPGTEPLRRLAAAARQRGISRFRGTILSDNVAIHRLMEKLSKGTMDERPRGSVTEVEIGLPASPDAPAIIASCVGRSPSVPVPR
jgi:hypothetical protein